MIRKWQWISAVAGVCIVAGALVPWSFSGSAVRQKVARQVMDATGLVARSEGRTVLALLPRPRIKIADVSISDGAGNLEIEADFLRGDLRILPMLAGRLELVSATLVSPRMKIDLDANPFGERGAIARAMETKPAPVSAPPSERLGVVSLVDGEARLRSKSRNLDLTVEKIDVTIDWRNLAAPGGVKGTFDLDGKTAEVAAWLAKPANLLRGERSELSLRVVSPQIKFDLNGSLSGGARLQFDGNIAASTPDMRGLMRTMWRDPPLPGPLLATSITGAARIRSTAISISSLRMSVDGNAYEGALALDLESLRPVLSGTLASEVIDLAPAFKDLPEPTTPDRQWSRSRLPAPDLSALDMDLRISAARARIGRTQLRDIGASVMINNGRAEISLVEAKVFGGVAKGKVTGQKTPAGFDLAGRMNFTAIDSAMVMNEVFRNGRLSGPVNADVSLGAAGDTVARLLSTLRGDAQFAFKTGEISGLDLEQALRRLEKRPLSIASEMRTGRTNFDAARINLKIDKGVATIERAEAKGPGVEFAVTGKANIADRALALALDARQTGAGPQIDDGPRLQMEITGDWSDPQLSIDARSLISRSRAAEPLLRSLAPPPPKADTQTRDAP